MTTRTFRCTVPKIPQFFDRFGVVGDYINYALYHLPISLRDRIFTSPCKIVSTE